VLGLVHLLLWIATLPLPHIDFNFYVDPAVQLAQTGHLVSPAAQHLDLTYTLGFFYMPPVFFVTLAGWLACFGESYGALLGFTLALHQVWLTCLWGLLRRRFGCGQLAAVMGLLAAFPLFNHGRPELLAHCFSVAGWLVATGTNRRSWIWGGSLLGLAVGTSPQFGGTAAAAVATHLLVRPGQAGRQRVEVVLRLATVALLVAGGVIVGIATQQGMLAVGWAQFQNSTLVRGRELNLWPSFNHLHYVVFTGIGLGLLTLVVALIGLLKPCRARFAPGLWPAVAAYFGGMVVWLVLAKGYFLGWAHFAYLAQPILHGQLLGVSRGWFRKLAWVTVSLFVTLHFYLSKAQFWYGAHSVAAAQVAARAVPMAPGELVAEDSFTYGALLDRPPLLHFELMHTCYWPRFLAVTSQSILARLPSGAQTVPLWPNRIVITAATLHEARPDPALYAQVAGAAEPDRVVLWGRSLTLLKDPLAICVFERRTLAKPAQPPGTIDEVLSKGATESAAVRL
jgi:hypothetical protein